MNPVIEVLLTIQFPEPLLENLRELSPRLHITALPARRPEDIPEEVWTRTEVLYTDQVLPEADQAPNLRWIQFHWAGIDALVQSPLLHKPDLTATTLSGSNAPQVAEYVMMMLLSLGHRLPALVESQAKSDWPSSRWDRFLPRELRGSTVGLVGYGSISRQVARLLQSFGATILATKRDAMHPADPGYIREGYGDPHGDFFTRLYPTQALRSMLKECDFVVVTVPRTPETQNMIGVEELKALKPTAFLINVSRGSVIDEEALVDALKENRLAGAALDVFAEEPLPPNHPLWKMPNVLITPHISGASAHYDERAIALFGDNLNRYLVGMPLFNRYDPELGY